MTGIIDERDRIAKYAQSIRWEFYLGVFLLFLVAQASWLRMRVDGFVGSSWAPLLIAVVGTVLVGLVQRFKVAL